MISLDSEICFRIREARRARKLSQSEVALEVGCKQPALSMFEQGDGTKLNDEVVKKLAQKFDVDLTAGADSPSSDGRRRSIGGFDTGGVRGFCPNPHCPTNQHLQIESRTLFMPDRGKADPVGGRFCAFCGEILERRCPNCGAPVHDGAVCSHCGEPYLAVLG